MASSGRCAGADSCVGFRLYSFDYLVRELDLRAEPLSQVLPEGDRALLNCTTGLFGRQDGGEERFATAVLEANDVHRAAVLFFDGKFGALDLRVAHAAVRHFAGYNHGVMNFEEAIGRMWLSLHRVSDGIRKYYRRCSRWRVLCHWSGRTQMLRLIRG